MNYKHIKGIFWGVSITVFATIYIYINTYILSIPSDAEKRFLYYFIMIFYRIGELVILYSLFYIRKNNSYLNKAVKFQFAYILIDILAVMVKNFSDLPTNLMTVIDFAGFIINIIVGFYMFFGLSVLTQKYKTPKLPRRLKIVFLIYAFWTILAMFFLFLPIAVLSMFPDVSNVVTYDQIQVMMAICFITPILAMWTFALRVIWDTYIKLNFNSLKT